MLKRNRPPEQLREESAMQPQIDQMERTGVRTRIGDGSFATDAEPTHRLHSPLASARRRIHASVGGAASRMRVYALVDFRQPR